MKSPTVAFFLSLIPGLGHLYIGRYIRTFFYLGGSVGLFLLTIIASVALNGGDTAVILGFIAVAILWGINMLDMIITISNKYNGVFQPKPVYENVNGQMILVEPNITVDPLEQAQKEERNKVLFLSIIPGASHLYMNYTKRGFSIIISILLALLLPFIIGNLYYTISVGYIVILVPIIAIYSIFDARRIVKAKQHDVVVDDRSIFDDIIANMMSEPRNDIALLLSLVPGFGHLLLGYAKQGFQLVLIMVSSFVLINEFNMHFLSYFSLLIWAYSFFDTLYIIRNQKSKQPANDTLLEAFKSYKRWIGFGLVAIGIYFIGDMFAVRLLDDINVKWYAFYREYKQTMLSALAAFVVILIGIKLMTSSIAERAKQKEGKK